MSVVPRRFDEHTTKVSVAGLGDRSAPILWPARMLGWDHTGVAHDLSGPLEAGEGAEFGCKSYRGDLADATQCLERINERSKLAGCVDDGAIDRSVEPLDTLGLVVDLQHELDQCGVLLDVRQSQSSYPLPPRRSPGSATFSGALPVTGTCPADAWRATGLPSPPHVLGPALEWPRACRPEPKSESGRRCGMIGPAFRRHADRS